MPARQLLRTRLHRPAVSARLVCRERLHELLDTGLEVPLTLVSAPAGYGKSILVSHWAESLKHPCAWVSLDEEDSELSGFLGYLVAGMRTAIPEACSETEALLQATTLPPLKAVVGCLANELQAIETPFVLVLDDYHFLSASSDVHTLLTLLLEHAPRNLHLVLISRRDPPLPLASLRGSGSLAEVRLQELRFTARETADFLEKIADFQASPEALSNLQDQIEGWVVGLQLVSLYVRDVGDPDQYLRELHGGIEQAQEYLVEQVLRRQSPAMQDWMLSTSILDRFCAELCDSVCVTGAPASDIDGQEFIATLRRGNLFTVSLDTRGKWFRYHHLFQSLLADLLRHRSSSQEIAELHLRASEWLEGEGLVGEALDHALTSGKAALGARLVERNWRHVMNRGDSFTPGKWLSRLASTEVQDRPELLLATAWQHLHRQQRASIPPILDRIDEVIAEGEETGLISAEIGLFRGFCSFFGGDSASSLKYLEEALEELPLEDVEFRAMTEVLYGLAGQAEGQMDRVAERLTDWLREPSQLHPRREANLVITLLFVHYIAGNPPETAWYISKGREVKRTSELASARPMISHMEGLFHLQRGELDEAIRILEELRGQEHGYHRRTAVDSLVALTLAYQASGQPEQAAAVLDSLGQFTDHLGPPFPNLADSAAARLSIMQGRSVPAVRWLETSALHPDEVMVFWLEAPQITRCRAMIAEGSASSLRKAEERLQEYVGRSEAQHNTCQLIGILALQAVAFDKQGRGDEAREALDRALTLAQPGGFLFAFLEIGPPMADLLRQQLRQEPDNDFIRRVLGAFGSDKPAPTMTPASLDQVESPTVREEEILELLAERLRDKEVAQKLGISSSTVKYHLKNLYQKLGVHGRREAVKKARELHLIN